jgi:hypothetical protein
MLSNTMGQGPNRVGLSRCPARIAGSNVQLNLMTCLKLSVAVAGIAALLTAGSLSATQPNTLTAAEVRDGWILLFDGETAFGWNPRGEAEWLVTEDALQPRMDSGSGMLVTTTEFADFELQLDFWIDDKANSGVFLRCPLEGEIHNATAYHVNLYDAHRDWPTGSLFGIARVAAVPQTTNRWNNLHLIAEGEELTVRLDGELLLRARDPKFSRGLIALQHLHDEGTIRFRNLKLRPLGLRSLFNGKDLTGWKEIPDRQSVYSVTDEGWLNVKDGPGDLQTVSTWGDFILQMDILSNGTHLNSGVFFRAIAGQFWSGYESQIRNQWQDEDRSRPVDFGTGGIYNRQPARRVVSTDHEWFTKTIVAHGRHMAVWVDGFQVSDFTDTRESHENARQGFRAEPGVISLQGHDPTTDLSFRNLQISELPPPRR